MHHTGTLKEENRKVYQPMTFQAHGQQVHGSLFVADQSQFF